MKHSIKRQMMVVFLGLMICLVAALFIINIRFLEPYYIDDKKTQFIEMYEAFDQAVSNGALKSGNASGELAYLAEKNNIPFLVEDHSGRFYTNVHDKEQLNNQLLGYLLNQAQKNSRVLEST